MKGARVGITAARRADEQAALVRSLGGIPRRGPAVDLDTAVPASDVRPALDALVAAPLDTAVFVTGVGARHLLAAAMRAEIFPAVLHRLRGAEVIARGTKPRRVLREFGIPVAWTADPPESAAIRDALVRAGVAGRRILVQCAGAAPDPMVGPLRAAGADVVAAHPYEIDLPPDARAAVGLAHDAAVGLLDALTFTSAHAVHGFLSIAGRAGVVPAQIAAGGALIVAVGPVTRDALLAHGLQVDVEPATPRMGAMFHALAAALAARRGAPVAP